MTPDEEFRGELGQGKREALERFYEKLCAAKGDEAFWRELTQYLPNGIEGSELAQLKQLPNHLKPGNFLHFVAQAPASALIAFFVIAMFFAGCNGTEATQEDDAVLEPPVTSEVTAESEVTTPISEAPSTNEAPVEGDVSLTQTKAQQVANAGEIASEPAPSQTPPTADEIRERLSAFINKAQLPVWEKRRLKRIVKRAAAGRIIDNSGQLEELEEIDRVFREENPQKIAKVLQEMVIFKRRKRPRVQARYKGVDIV